MSQQPARYPLLESIDSPARLRALPRESLPPLAEELRDFIIHSVARTGGHLAASLGTVELALALHYVFHTPEDRLVWDVGHQAYAHKILTGRREAMGGIRQKGGISGFLKRAESEYDAFGAGHSSTSVSAALGMAIALRQQGSDRRVAAIIGDGAMTAGMAYEALNHAGHVHADLLVILNDNEMSISPNVGGMSNYLAKLLSGRFYASMREGGKKMLSAMPQMRELARRAEEHMKGMVVPGTLFEELGFNYIGPVDGHDLDTLVTTLGNLYHLKGPQFLHVITRKGKGYPPAEANPCAYHGVSPYDPADGRLQGQGSKGPTYTQVFGRWLCDMAARDPRLVAITPAMCEGSGMVEFSREYPERFFDVGIAEQHSITLAAGMACEGLKPVVAIYSTFLQRGYDQLIHDVALQKLPVLFAIDRAGIVGPDGPTHDGVFDLSYLRCIPELVVMAPADENECRQMLSTGFHHDGPSAVRYPRGCGPGVPVDTALEPLPLGQAQRRREGRGVALLAFGSLVQPALEAGEALDATVVNMRFVKPLDRALVLEMAATHDLLVTLEENVIAGGAGSAVRECLDEAGVVCPILHLGLPDAFGEHGGREALLAERGLDAEGILAAIRAHPVLGQGASPLSANSY
ncbi:MAG TPA: 1-deoxy-D-xylulose-5-phosphate synthase [Gammaproteobacteria bacterium]|nr:1-deoxy-D-xylulose-5-phosphate synthase [Gammaproteobacteria bacterium]